MSSERVSNTHGFFGSVIKRPFFETPHDWHFSLRLTCVGRPHRRRLAKRGGHMPDALSDWVMLHRIYVALHAVLRIYPQNRPQLSLHRPPNPIRQKPLR